MARCLRRRRYAGERSGGAAFDKVGEEQVGNTLSWIIRYRDTGAVLRSEIVAGGTRRIPVRATITVTHGLEPALGFRVPIEMLERYDNPRRAENDVVVARATYSEFRRFDWRTLLPPAR